MGAMRKEVEIDLAWSIHRPDPRRVVIARLRARVAAEQNHRCCYCGVRTTQEQGHDHSATLEHVVPVSLGGADTYANVVLACFGCNQARGSRMDTLPVLIVCAMNNARPPAWRART